jgi:hypothetical protein
MTLFELFEIFKFSLQGTDSVIAVEVLGRRDFVHLGEELIMLGNSEEGGLEREFRYFALDFFQILSFG